MLARVLAAGVLVAAAPAAHAETVASDGCRSGALAYGYESPNAYALFGYYQPDAQTTWVCVHFGPYNGEFIGVPGGKFVVEQPAQVTQGTDIAQCAAGTDVLVGALGDASDPSTYLPYHVRVAQDASTFSVCVTAGSTVRTLTLGGLGTAPEVSFVPDEAVSTHEPPPPVAGGSASSTCTSTYSSGVTAATPSEWTFAGERRESEMPGFEVYYVCLRALTPAGPIGGRIAIHRVPDVYQSQYLFPTDACTANVLSNSVPIEFAVTRSALPDSEGNYSLCFAGGGVNIGLKVAPGHTQLPDVEFTPDA